MSEADRIWEELDITFSRWGLQEIPFTESASTLSLSQLREVFTGRTEELKHVLNLFRGRERKRMLFYGWIGIGKTAFILEVLGVLQRKSKDTLTAYISLPPDTDLATAALIALAREMEDDEWAQHQLNQMGLRPRKPVRRRKGKIKAGVSFLESDVEEETISVTPPRFPALSFEDLLERALQKHARVVIAIDDLDKVDPAHARQLLHNAQGMLKGGAWFILTGHLAYADQQLRGQPGLTAEDYYVLDLVLDKGILSDATVTLEDLERIRVKEFSEILPILEKLVQLDLVRRLPAEHAAEYKPTPLLSAPLEDSEQQESSNEG